MKSSSNIMNNTETKYLPLLFKLNDVNIDFLNIFNTDKKDQKKSKDTADVKLSSTMMLPLITLGFHHFIRRTRNSMVITKKQDFSNDIYYIVNKFECNIPNYDENIDKVALEYFNALEINNELLLSHDIYIFWEILILFKLSDYKSFTVINNHNNDLDKFKIAIHNYYKKILNIDAPNISEIDADIVLGNDKLENLELDDNYEEQKSYYLLLSEIISMLKCQNENGSFILKIFDIFTMPTVKLLYILCSLYKECYIYKPYFSRSSSTEKYIICKYYKYNKANKQIKSCISSLSKCSDILKSNNIYDIYPDLMIPHAFLYNIKFINIKIANVQQIVINQIIKYITQGNYYGDKYHSYREQQIESIRWWSKTFFPLVDSMINKEEIQSMLNFIEEKNNVELSRFISALLI